MTRQWSGQRESNPFFRRVQFLLCADFSLGFPEASLLFCQQRDCVRCAVEVSVGSLGVKDKFADIFREPI
jgi:hypothetical protein